MAEERNDGEGEDTPPSRMVAREMERLRGRIERGSDLSEFWKPAASPEALRRVLQQMGSIEADEVTVSASGAAAILFTTMPAGALRVRRLLLGACSLGDPGAEAVALELEANTAVTELCMRHNNMTEAGARSLARVLRNNATLRQLDVYRNDISTGGVAALAEALAGNATLERLALGGTHCCSEDVRALADAAVAHPSLTDLFYRGMHLNDEGARALADMLGATRSLRRLDLLESMRDGEAALAFLAGLRHATSLTHLNLSRNPFGDGGAVEIAAALSADSCALVDLVAYECGIGAAGAVALAGALWRNQTLTSLDLRFNGDIGDEGGHALFEALKHDRALAALYLTVCDIGNAPALAEALEVNRTLKVLDLSFNRDLGLGAGIHGIAAALARPGCALEALDLSAVELGDDFGRALAEAMAANTSLTAFRCQRNPGLSDSLRERIRAATDRNRRLREAEAVECDFLRSATGRDAVPWIAADVVTNIVAEYAGRGWSEAEIAACRRWGSHFFPEDEPFHDRMGDL